MRPFSLLFLLLLIVPLTEIYVLVEVGRKIGSLPTIFLLVFTAVLGALLVRMQGMSTYISIHQAINQGRMPAIEMIEGVMIMIAGVLLLTPGFITDSVGFAFLVPGIRRLLIGALIRHPIQPPPNQQPDPIFRESPTRKDGPRRAGRVIEGELDED
ncbi:MAG: FxsA family protein [Gammaproteobacteria bacterium]